MPAEPAGPKLPPSAARCRPKDRAVPSCRRWRLACQKLLTYPPKSVRWNEVHSFGLRIVLRALTVKTTVPVQGHPASPVAPVAEQSVAVLAVGEGVRCRSCASEGQPQECVGCGASSQRSVAVPMRALGPLRC